MAFPFSDDDVFSAPQLAAALALQDNAEVALALRQGPVVVPLLDVPGPPQVRVFRRDGSERYMMLLFSSRANYAAMVPQESEHKVMLYDRDTLLGFLQQNEAVLEAVIFDVAGPSPMQATPADIIEALSLSAE